MPYLPLVEWPKDVAERRLEFLKAAAHFAPPAMVDGDDGGDRLLDRVSDRLTDPRALLAAADLAFAIDRTSDGLACLREAVDEAFTQEGDLRLTALPGAIAGVALTRPVENGFLIRRSSGRDDPPARHYQNDPMTPAGLSVALDLLLASLASGVPLEDFVQANQSASGSLLPPNEAIVQGLPFFDPLRWDAARRHEMARRALWVNARNWAADLWLHRRDQYHWEQARVRGPLIDMRRLAFELAVRRWPEGAEFIASRGERLGDGLPEDLEEFVRELADEILRVREKRPDDRA